MARAAGVPASTRARAATSTGAGSDAALAANNRKRLKAVSKQQAQNRKLEQANIKAVQAMQAQQHAARMAQMKREKAEEASRQKAAMSLDKQRQAGLMQQFRRQQAAELTHQRKQAAAERIRQRDMLKQARATQQARHRFARGVGFTAGSGVVRGAAAVGRVGALAATIGGGLLLGSALGTELRETKLAGQLAAQTGQTEVKGPLLQEARKVKGFTGEEALGGMMSFVDITGDLDMARGVIQEMGNTALATNTNLTDMGSAVGSAFIAISDKIKDPTKRLEALRAVMDQMAGAGAIGAVEVKDMARDMAAIAGASQFFDGDPEKNMKLMNAIAQASRQRGGSKSAAEATKSVQRLSTDLLNKTKQKRLNALGINIFSDKTKTNLKDPREIILDILEKTKGDLTKVAPILNERSLRAVRGFAPLYTEAEKREKGSGKQAVLDEFDKFLKAQLTEEDKKKRVQSRLEDPDMRFKEAMKDFNHAVGSQLLPVLVDLVPKFVKLIPTIVEVTEALGKFLEFAANNPWEGLGLIIGAAIVKEIALAGIGKMVGAAVTSTLMQTRMGGAGAAGAVTRAGGMLGGAASVAGGAAGATGLAKAGKAAKAAKFLGISRGMGAAGIASLATGTLLAGSAAAAGAGAAIWQGSKARDEGVIDFLLADKGKSSADWNAKWEAKARRQRQRTNKRRAGEVAQRRYSGDTRDLEEAFYTTDLMKNAGKLSEEGKAELSAKETALSSRYTSFMPMVNQPRLDSLEATRAAYADADKPKEKADPAQALDKAAGKTGESAAKLAESATKLNAAADRLSQVPPQAQIQPSIKHLF